METIKSTVHAAWLILSQREDKPTQVALAICIIVVAGFVGCFCAFWYGFSSREGGVFHMFMGGFVALLSCAGSFSIGGILGLLFGSPTMGNGQSRGNAENGHHSQSGVRPNTSLERIADWLTTMIVGLGLVNLGSIKSEATTMSIWLTQSITGSSSLNGTPGITIAVGFGFLGFLLLYLWSMRFLPSELRDSYDALRIRVENAEAKAKRLLTQFKDNVVFSVPIEKIEKITQKLKDAGVTDDCVADIASRYRYAKKADDEPMDGFGPSELNGCKISAEVADAGSGKFDARIKISVPDDSDVTRVFWLLHNSFSPDVISECEIKEGSAIYTTIIDEPFWVGAVMPKNEGGQIKLGLSLADVEDAPLEFRGKVSE